MLSFIDERFGDAANIDKATFPDPQHDSEGVRHVLVNGRVTIANGVHTGVRAGRVLRGPGVRPQP